MVHKLVNGRTRKKKYSNTVYSSTDIQKYLTPTTVKKLNDGMKSEGSQSIITQNIQENTENLQYHMCLRFTLTEKRDRNGLLKELSQGALVAVLDGSCFQEERACSAAWVITILS